MPGLVQASSENAAQITLATVGKDDRVTREGNHHRLLIRPDVFHVSTLFRPTLAYLGRIAAALPSGLDVARSTSAVLDDFVLKIYLPQLEDRVSELFQQAVTGMKTLTVTDYVLSLASQAQKHTNRIRRPIGFLHLL